MKALIKTAEQAKPSFKLHRQLRKDPEYAGEHKKLHRKQFKEHAKRQLGFVRKGAIAGVPIGALIGGISSAAQGGVGPEILEHAVAGGAGGGVLGAGSGAAAGHLSSPFSKQYKRHQGELAGLQKRHASKAKA